MRPLRLTVTAFGPYAGTEVVDFDALTELGLFVVAGNNGAGKTTIFDALHYSLFGTLPGRRASYIRLKSDHADDTVECKVTFEFAAHGKHWRVERSPKQKRPKRRGNGFTEVDRRATLYRLDHGTTAAVDSNALGTNALGTNALGTNAPGPVAAVAIANKIGEVDEQCRQLVGLSGKQFERVALLPQGEFSRVLRESSTDRRELLRTLFSSEIFGDATSLLTEQAALATAADRSVLERLDHQQGALAQSLGELIGQPVTNTVAQLQGAITDFRRVQLGQLTRQSHELHATSNAAAKDHQAALDICQRIQRRAQVERDYHAHHAATAQHHHDVARLEQARAAVPVTNLIRATAEQEQRHAAANERVSELHTRLNRALHAADNSCIETVSHESLGTLADRLTELARQLHDRREASLRVRDLQAATNRSHGELRRILNDISALDEQIAVARTRQRQLRSQVESLESAADLAQCEREVRIVTGQLHQRTELQELENTHQDLVRRTTELDASLAQRQVAYEQASQAHTTLPALQAKADAAFATLESCTRRSEAAELFTTATARLTEVRTEHNTARASAEHLWDAFIAGTAARVAEALIDDEPCPVCGSAEHPSPATFEPGDQVVTQADVTAARGHVETLYNEVRHIETQIENLRSVDTDIASLSAVEARAEISTAKAMALGARTIAEDARTAAAKRDSLATRLEHDRASRAELDTELRALDQRCNHLRGALGELAHESVATLQAQSQAAEHARTIAEQREAHGAELASALTAAEQDLDTIGLGQLAAEARRSAAASQHADRQNELDHATATLCTLDDELTSPDSGDQPRATALASDHYEQRAQAARHASELVGELTTAVALQHEAADGIRRARSLLDDRIGQSPFTSPDTAIAAYVEPQVIEHLEAQTAAFAATGERLQGQLQELADLPESEPDIDRLQAVANQAAQAYGDTNRTLITTTNELDRCDHDLAAIVGERNSLQTGDHATRRLERVAALVKGDNDRNTSLENWVLAAHLRDVVELANIRLARSTHQRFQLCVLDDGENKRGKWGLDLGVEDTVTGTRRPTAGLSGGELFQASLALALGLADAVMNQTAGVRIDALFIDEGFGSLDEVSVERAIDLLDELRDRGAMVGVITHVPALLDALPVGVMVIDAPDGHGSTIQQAKTAA